MFDEILGSLWNKRKVAKELGVDVRTVERLRKAGHFRCCKIGRSVRFWSKSVLDYALRQTELDEMENPTPDNF